MYIIIYNCLDIHCFCVCLVYKHLVNYTKNLERDWVSVAVIVQCLDQKRKGIDVLWYVNLTHVILYEADTKEQNTKLMRIKIYNTR